MQTGLSENLDGVEDIPKTSILDRELKRLGVDVAALQETRLANFGSIKERNYTFFWQGLKENERRLHGVGFAVNNRLLPMIETPEGGTERLMSLRIRTATGYATLLSCYAPTLDADPIIKEKFYHQLDDKVKETPTNDALYLLGDFNARVGAEDTLWPSVLGKHGIGKTNDNGQRLLEFCSFHHLCITNTFFKNKDLYKASWRHPRSKIWHQLDLIVTKQKDIKNVHNTRAYHSADCNSDHSLIRSKVKIVPKKIFTSKKKGASRIDTSRVSDPNKKANFDRLFKASNNDSKGLQKENASQTWDKLRDNIYKSALESFGEKKHTDKDWFQAHAETLIPTLEAKRSAMLALKDDPNEQNKAKYKATRNRAQKVARQCANEYYCALSDSIQKASDTGNTRKMHEGIKKVIGKEIRKPAPLKSKSGELINDKGQKLNRLVEHYSDLYSKDTTVSHKAIEEIPQMPVMSELDRDPTISDLEKAIDALNCGKAPGQDSIPPDVIKACRETLTQPLMELLLQCWREGQVPQDMRDAKIITLYKNKGERSDCNNYRGISLLSIVGKVFARVVLARLQTLASTVYPEAQCGFRSERSTIDMIFATRQIQEKCVEQQMPLYIAFIDLTKAFDLVSRTGLFKILHRIGCPDTLLNVITSYHRDMEGVISFDGDQSDPFPIKNGVKQGCVLAPTLFGIFFSMLLHFAFKDSSEGVYLHTRSDGSMFNLARLRAKTKRREVLIRELLFADDAALTSHTQEGLQTMLNSFSGACKEFGLTISIKKTQVMGLNIPAPPELYIDNQLLEAVDVFPYLGSIIAANSSLAPEIKRRIAKASSTLARLSKRVWDNKKLTTETKMKVYQACVLSTLLYGSESWATYTVQENCLETFHMGSLRRILGIKWQDKVTNIHVLEESGMLSIHSHLIKRRLRWIGHVRRMQDGRIPKDVMFGQLKEGKRKRGRPKLRYTDVVKRDLHKVKVEHTKWENVAADRKVWKSKCKEGIKLAESDRISYLKLKRAKRKAKESEKETPLNTYSCHRCDQSFSVQRHLTTHLSVSHKRKVDWGKSYQRQRPVKKVTWGPELEEPPLTHFKCPSCKSLFTSQSMLTAHLHTVHKKGINWG